MNIHKHHLVLTICLSILSTWILSGCADNKSTDVINLTIWHVYGDQSNSPMDEMIHEFNTTTGAEKGINVTTENITSVSRIQSELSDALKGKAGAMEVPDLVTCSIHDVKQAGPDVFLNWDAYFSKEELEDLVPAFVESGRDKKKLKSLPIMKSASVLFMNQSEADRFFKETDTDIHDLDTWDGFMKTAEMYYDYSSGKPFCSIDYLASFVDLYAMDKGDTDLYEEDGWYDPDNTELKEAWNYFAKALSKGWITIPESFSSQDITTSAALSSLGSSAGILYYNDTVTDAYGNTEPLNLKIYTVPYTDENRYYTQGGVGLSAIKTTDQKAEAVSVFAHWLLEPEHNLKLSAEMGYMPANMESFEHVKDYVFNNVSFQSLYNALNQMNNSYTAVSTSSSPDYFIYASRTADFIRSHVKDSDADTFGNSIWDYMMSLRYEKDNEQKQ